MKKCEEMYEGAEEAKKTAYSSDPNLFLVILEMTNISQKNGVWSQCLPPRRDTLNTYKMGRMSDDTSNCRLSCFEARHVRLSALSVRTYPRKDAVVGLTNYKCSADVRHAEL